MPNEILADLAVSTATKLQCYRVFAFFFFYFTLLFSSDCKREHVWTPSMLLVGVEANDIIISNTLFLLQHLGKYFKQSAKALEQQVAREARFYGALIR